MFGWMDTTSTRVPSRKTRPLLLRSLDLHRLEAVDEFAPRTDARVVGSLIPEKRQLTVLAIATLKLLPENERIAIRTKHPLRNCEIVPLAPLTDCPVHIY